MDDQENQSLIRKHLLRTKKYLLGFLTWIFAGFCLGVLGGTIGAAFSHAISFSTSLRAEHSWILYLLPLGGLFIVWLYGLQGWHPTDTNGVLLAVHTPAGLPKSTMPLIFISTVITHLLGGSAGREGAALQIGGVLGSELSKLFKKGEKDSHMFVLAGMSAVFAALFGTPITAAIFAVEVASVGIIHFSGLIPCLTASITATWIVRLFAVEKEFFPLSAILDVTFKNVAAVVGLAVVMAVLSIIYCVSLRQGGNALKRLIPSPYLRIFLGGSLVVILSVVLGTTKYNGGGIPVISQAVAGNASPSDFAWKLLFTVLTMACGYKGGEIVPSMFIGATLGCVLGPLLGLSASCGAAVGLLCMFCGSLNCPISSIFLGVELFGGDNILFFAIAAAVSYVLSANYGLYKEQKIMYSKIRPEFINKYTY